MSFLSTKRGEAAVNEGNLEVFVVDGAWDIKTCRGAAAAWASGRSVKESAGQVSICRASSATLVEIRYCS